MVQLIALIALIGNAGLTVETGPPSTQNLWMTLSPNVSVAGTFIETQVAAQVGVEPGLFLSVSPTLGGLGKVSGTYFQRLSPEIFSPPRLVTVPIREADRTMSDGQGFQLGIETDILGIDLDASYTQSSSTTVIEVDGSVPIGGSATLGLGTEIINGVMKINVDASTDVVRGTVGATPSVQYSTTPTTGRNVISLRMESFTRLLGLINTTVDVALTMCNQACATATGPAVPSNSIDLGAALNVVIPTDFLSYPAQRRAIPVGLDFETRIPLNATTTAGFRLGLSVGSVSLGYLTEAGTTQLDLSFQFGH
ncbi:MAG: hypothetical protein ACE5JP_16085 [Candidatus Bipolaricaulia bacterium]